MGKSSRTGSSEPPRPVGVDLFCGAGGISLGFEQAGFDVLAAIDHDPVHLAVHERNIPQAFPVCSNISDVSGEVVEAAVRKGWASARREGEWDGVIDCLFGGPSCQGFSDIGRQREDDHRNQLVFEFARLVRQLSPKTFLIENVPGLLFSKVRDKLDELQRQLRSAGYTLQASLPNRLDAADYGVPQRRRRVFIVGVAKGVPVPRAPRMSPGPSVGEALDDLPDVDDYLELLNSDRLELSKDECDALKVAASRYVRSLRSRHRFEYLRTWNSTVLTGSQRTVHSPEVRNRFELLAPGEPDKTSRTSRLDRDDYARTLRAGTGVDHGSYTAPRPIHHNQPRVVTVREAARLHSFPDWFDFHVAKWHAFREIGNSVPPRLAGAVADTIVEALGVDPVPPARRISFGPDTLLSMSLRQAADYYGYDRTLLPLDVRRQKETMRDSSNQDRRSAWRIT